MTYGKDANAFSENEFYRMLRGHVRDIRHLAVFCVLDGEDPEMVADWLDEATAELTELARTLPARRSDRRPRSG